jgi:hypothetical protein
MSDFKVDDRVAFVADNMTKKGKLYFNEHEAVPFGVVTAVDSEKKKVTVKWDKKFSFMNQYNKTTDAKNLMLESECLPELSRLEEEFRVFEKEIYTRLDQAGKLILEADKLANSKGKDLGFMEALSPLTKAMEEIGWRTSSLRC